MADSGELDRTYTLAMIDYARWNWRRREAARQDPFAGEVAELHLALARLRLDAVERRIADPASPGPAGSWADLGR